MRVLQKSGRVGGNTSSRETPDQIGRVGMLGMLIRFDSGNRGVNQ